MRSPVLDPTDADELQQLASRLARRYDGPLDEREYAAGMAAAYALDRCPRSRLLGLARGLRLVLRHRTSATPAGRMTADE